LEGLHTGSFLIALARVIVLTQAKEKPVYNGVYRKDLTFSDKMQISTLGKIESRKLTQCSYVYGYMHFHNHSHIFILVYV